MAYASFTNIRVAIRERIEGTLTDTVRAVTAGRFTGGLWDNLNDAEKKRRALVGSRYDVRIVSASPSAFSSPVVGNAALVDFETEVLCVYKLAHGALSDSTRDTMRATAEQDIDILRQALTVPDSIDDTAAGAATGLVSGQLMWMRSSMRREEFGEGDVGEAGLLEMTHTFTGTIIVSQAIT